MDNTPDGQPSNRRPADVTLSCPTCGERFTCDRPQHERNITRSLATGSPHCPGCDSPWCSLVVVSP